MKTPLLFCLSVLLISGCDKPEEKKTGITAPPKQEERLKPSSDPQPAPPPQKVVPPQELEAFYAEVQALEKKYAVLKQPGITIDSPELADLKKASEDLMQKRVKLTSGMSLEQKREIAKKSLVLRDVNAAIIELQFGKPGIPGQEVLPDPRTPPAAPAEGTPPENGSGGTPAPGRRTPVQP